MSYKNYSKEDFEDLKKQHNIMVLVGNGFDISVLKRFGTGFMGGKSTSYKDFYEYLKYFKKCNENELYKRMSKDLKAGKNNWCDFEMTIDEILVNEEMEIGKLEKQVDELQNFFTEFLNLVVNTDVLIALNKYSKENQLATQSLAKFLGDLDESQRTPNFVWNIDYYDLFNYLFVNFNYTNLLDNYMYLDKKQFEPHIYKFADRNFDFSPNPIGNLKRFSKGYNLSSYVLTEFIHPNGIQTIPRSLLFGTEIQNYKKNEPRKRLVKSYWAQYEVKYAKYFEDTELYIIFGMSISKTDAWWMNKICESLKNRKSELIIYYFSEEETEEEIKEKFISICSCCLGAGDEIEKIKKRIFIIKFAKNNTFFLGLDKKE